MNEEDIDYENLDDLPLLDHIEWNHCMMCQHFSGHKAKQILAAFRSSLATNSY